MSPSFIKSIPNSAKVGGISQPWVEKYRPKTIDEVVSQEEVVASLSAAVKVGNLPHLLFYGPPGTGKTSTILALSHQIFGPELYKERVLELNASDERGIDVVREKVKKFAQSLVSVSKTAPLFKVVILDEADSMTKDAQAALRRTMEVYSKMTRFCLICNYVTRIIEPLTSRCAKFRFKPLPYSLMEEHIKMIAEQEAISLGDNMIETLIKVSSGDLRKCITLLQTCFRWKDQAAITVSDVLSVAGVVPEKVILELVECLRSGSFTSVSAKAKALINEGYSVTSVLQQVHLRSCHCAPSSA
ncbi:replication factor C subunit 4-like, partial [Zophobas morio]|uniref:replication factor C subunit 4-like n=1 Tax=Zophobas morio TaxID=2755281 RepID=UPI0030836C19